MPELTVIRADTKNTNVNTVEIKGYDGWVIVRCDDNHICAKVVAISDNNVIRMDAATRSALDIEPDEKCTFSIDPLPEEIVRIAEKLRAEEPGVITTYNIARHLRDVADKLDGVEDRIDVIS